jgi:hypothetical protein
MSSISWYGVGLRNIISELNLLSIGRREREREGGREGGRLVVYQ